MKSLLLQQSILSVTIASATTNPSGGSNNPTFVAYGEIQCTSSDNDAPLACPNTDEVGDASDDSSSIISSSVLYQDGALFSDVMSINGGDSLMIYEYDSEGFDEDHDDDGDGHSSMLSNASLRKAKSLVMNAADDTSHSTTQYPVTNSNYEENRPAVSAVSSARTTATFTRSKNAPILARALSIRGGGSPAVSSVLSSDLSKKLLVAAIVTLVFEGLMGHVLEFFKIVMQTSPPGTTYGKVFKDITNEKGFAGMWDGFVPWGVIQAVLKGGVFGLAHAAATNVFKPMANEGKIPMQLAMTLAGGVGGGFQGFVLSPTLLMKTRVMTNPVFREKMSMLKTTWLSFCIGAEVIQKEGFMTLMKGSNVFATKRVFDWSTRYYFSDLFESLFGNLKGTPLTPLERSASSFLGGVASTCLTLPLDVLVAKTQDAKKAGVKVSAVKMFQDELEALGWSGLKDRYMQGFEARLLHVCLTTVVVKTGAPIVHEMLFGKQIR